MSAGPDIQVGATFTKSHTETVSRSRSTDFAAQPNRFRSDFEAQPTQPSRADFEAQPDQPSRVELPAFRFPPLDWSGEPTI